MEWTGVRYADSPVVEVQTWIDSLPESVWKLVSDIELIPTMTTDWHSVRRSSATTNTRRLASARS